MRKAGDAGVPFRSVARVLQVSYLRSDECFQAVENQRSRNSESTSELCWRESAGGDVTYPGGDAI